MHHESHVACKDMMTAIYQQHAFINHWITMMTPDRYRELVATSVPATEGIIFNDPATIVFWADGTKTVAKTREGDDYDPIFGMLACIVRKLTNNRGHGVNQWEPTIELLTQYITNAEECRMVAKILNVTAQILEKDGVMDGIAEMDAKAAEKADDVDSEVVSSWNAVTDRLTNVLDTIESVLTDPIDHIITKKPDDTVETEEERVRRIVRDLIDKGEL